MERLCKNCGKPFEAKRTTAEFCSANCRVKFNNKKDKPVKERKTDKKSVTEAIAPVVEQTVLLNAKINELIIKKIKEQSKQSAFAPENKFYYELRKKKLGY